MRKLILVKHSQPQVESRIPSDQWALSDVGRNRCEPLADRLKAYSPAILVSSEEPKATQTAEIVSKRLGLPMEIAKGLHEHDRRDVPLMDTRDFLGSMALLFKRPRERIIGGETAEEALSRFSQAVDAAIASHPEGNLAVFTHGTVIALFVAQHTKVEAYPLWRQMGLPSYVVLSLPDFARIEQVDRV